MSDARILERGYRRYEGERLGLLSVMRSLVRHSAQRVLGLRRPARAKILPVLSALCAYLPAVVFIGIAAIVPPSRLRDQFLPTYPQYYGFITSALIVFAVFVAPEALCPDRLNGLLGYYLAAPLTRLSYVVSKVVAVFTLLLLTTLGPPLLLMIAFMLQGIGPHSALDVLIVLLRVIVSGALVSTVYTAVSLGVSSLTDRRAFAAAGTLLVIVVSGVVTGALVNGASAPRALLAGNLTAAPFVLVFRIYGDAGVNPDVPTIALVIGVIGWTLLGFGTLWVRYRRIDAKVTSLPPPVVPIVTFTAVSKWFGDVVAVSEVSFSVGPGITALLGPNGAGKSTVLRLLVGLARPSQGEVRVLGRDPRHDLDLLRLIGLVPQQEALFERMTPLELVTATTTLSRVDQPRERAAHALHLVDLDPSDRRTVSTYSKGMRQRVKIALALAHDPQVLVLDEPLNGLDPRQRLHLTELIRRIAAVPGRCVVLSSHVLDEVERFGSRILVIAKGRLAAEGPFRAIRELMDDRPHRLQLVTDQPARLAAGLLGAEAVLGARVTGPDRIEVETSQVQRFRRTVAGIARDRGCDLDEVIPLDDDLDSVFRYLVGR